MGSWPIAASYKQQITSARTEELAALMPSPQDCCTAVGGKPGLRIAATQRASSQCLPISLTAVVSTAVAVLWLYSLRVISATRVKLRTSATPSAWAAETSAAPGAPPEDGTVAASGGKGAGPA